MRLDLICFVRIWDFFPAGGKEMSRVLHHSDKYLTSWLLFQKLHFFLTLKKQQSSKIFMIKPNRHTYWCTYFCLVFMSETVFYFAHVQNIVYAIHSLVSLSMFGLHSSYDTVTKYFARQLQCDEYYVGSQRFK